MSEPHAGADVNPKAVRVAERTARSVLSKTGIPGARYALNPYVGCAHACGYCYAEFMKRYTGHTEAWGSFVDVKVNAPEVLERELRRAAPGPVMLSSVTDPYQALEERYRLTRRCLELLRAHRFPVRVLTKSPLVLRDVDLLRAEEVEVGITITTDEERMRLLFEPGAPPIAARVAALRGLKEAGVRTYVFVGPMLPMRSPKRLAAILRPWADSVLIDAMNYTGKTRALFRRLGQERWLDEAFTDGVARQIREELGTVDVRQC
jgi:DNA repair photolyase